MSLGAEGLLKQGSGDLSLKNSPLGRTKFMVLIFHPCLSLFDLCPQILSHFFLLSSLLPPVFGDSSQILFLSGFMC